jgi:hypothetical protein
MERGDLEITMVDSMKDLLLMEKLMEEQKLAIDISCMKENGKKENRMEQENRYGRMNKESSRLSILVNISKEKSMDLGNIDRRME